MPGRQPVVCLVYAVAVYSHSTNHFSSNANLCLAHVRTHVSESESTLLRGLRDHTQSAAQAGQSAEPMVTSQSIDAKERSGVGASLRASASLCLQEIFPPAWRAVLPNHWLGAQP